MLGCDFEIYGGWVYGWMLIYVYCRCIIVEKSILFVCICLHCKLLKCPNHFLSYFVDQIDYFTHVDLVAFNEHQC